MSSFVKRYSSGLHSSLRRDRRHCLNPFKTNSNNTFTPPPAHIYLHQHTSKNDVLDVGFCFNSLSRFLVNLFCFRSLLSFKISPSLFVESLKPIRFALVSAIDAKGVFGCNVAHCRFSIEAQGLAPAVSLPENISPQHLARRRSGHPLLRPVECLPEALESEVRRIGF
jgi:hypothetical protein